MLMSSLSPILASGIRYKTERELRDVFIRTTSQMSSRLPDLIEDAKYLRSLLRGISVVLDQIKSHALEEIKHAPEMAVLAELWMALAHRDEYVEHQSHQGLLTDITAYYASATDIVKNTLHALNKMRSDLDEFRSLQASPVLMWRDVPWEVTIEMMGKWKQRLDSGIRRFDDYERATAMAGPNSPRYVKGKSGRGV